MFNSRKLTRTLSLTLCFKVNHHLYKKLPSLIIFFYKTELMNVHLFLRAYLSRKENHTKFRLIIWLVIWVCIKTIQTLPQHRLFQRNIKIILLLLGTKCSKKYLKLLNNIVKILNFKRSPLLKLSHSSELLTFNKDNKLKSTSLQIQKFKFTFMILIWSFISLISHSVKFSLYQL